MNAGSRSKVTIFALARLAPIVALILFLLIVPSWQARCRCRASPTIREEITGVVSDSGVEVRSVVGHAHHRWELVLKARIASDVARIYTSPQIALYLPSNCFESREAWEGALSRIRSRVSRVKG
jgi:hypothetical protein